MEEPHWGTQEVTRGLIQTLFSHLLKGSNRRVVWKMMGGRETKVTESWFLRPECPLILFLGRERGSPQKSQGL